MNDIRRESGRVIVMVMLATLMLACGAMETEAPAKLTPVEPKEESPEASTEPAATAVTEEEESIDEGARSEQFPEDEELPEGDNRCVRICFKLAWCGEEDADFVACVENCEAAEYDAVVTESVFACLDEAQTCGEVGACEDEIEACYEVCGVYELCGTSGSADSCQGWCADEIWSGRLDWEAQGCVEAAGRNWSCGDIEGCGLSSPLR